MAANTVMLWSNGPGPSWPITICLGLTKAKCTQNKLSRQTLCMMAFQIRGSNNASTAWFQTQNIFCKNEYHQNVDNYEQDIFKLKLIS